MRVLLAVIPFAACASGPSPRPQPPGSRGARASDHMEQARQHDEAAREAAAYPDMRQEDGTGRVTPVWVATPWKRHWDTTEDHRRLAAMHRSAAAQIQQEFSEACGDRSEASITVSPLVKYGVGGRPTDDGVVIFLTPDGGNPDTLMADLRCHRAWMMLQPVPSMDLCPLDLEGLSVEAAGGKEGVSVTLHVKDHALVPELQRRAARDLEQGAALHHTDGAAR